MTAEAVNEAMSRMLSADDDIGRQMALGLLLERLVHAAGQPAERLGMVSAAAMLLWQATENGEDSLQAACVAAKTMLSFAKPDVAELSRLAAVGRALLAVALELQGEKLLALPERTEYAPEEGDWAIWLGKHVVRVQTVEKITVVGDDASEDHISHVTVRTAGDRVIPVSPKELELYRRDGEGPVGDFGLVR